MEIGKLQNTALHIFSLLIYLMKLHEFFFFVQAHAEIFFSSSISCMNFFFGSDTPLPGYLMIHSLVSDAFILYTRAKIDQVDATLFVEQRLNNVVIKVQQHLLN